MALSFSIHRKVFSSTVSRESLGFRLPSGESLRETGSVLSFNSPSNSGLMVEIAPRQFQRFPLAAEAAHHFRRVPKSLVIGINLPDREYTRVFGWGVFPFILLFVPIENPPDKWRNELCPRIRRGDGLRQVKEEGHVAVDPLFCKRRAASISPGGGHFDQDAFARHSGFGILVDKEPSLSHQCFRIKGNFGARFRGNAPRNDL